LRAPQWRWYRVGDLDPKFKYFLAGLMVNMLIFVVVSCLIAFSFDVGTAWYGPDHRG